MSSVFLSYRRGDTAGYAGRLRSELGNRLGRDAIFRDIDGIPLGSNFVEVIGNAVGRCKVLLVMIGVDWLAPTPTGTRRLDNPMDFVRSEIQAGLDQGKEVIPVLVDGARMPAVEDLPAVLEGLAYRQAIELSDTRWDYDLDRLAKHIESAIKTERAAPLWTPAPAATPAAVSVPLRRSTHPRTRRPSRWIAILGCVLAVALIVPFVESLGGTTDPQTGAQDDENVQSGSAVTEPHRAVSQERQVDKRFGFGAFAVTLGKAVYVPGDTAQVTIEALFETSPPATSPSTPRISISPRAARTTSSPGIGFPPSPAARRAGESSPSASRNSVSTTPFWWPAPATRTGPWWRSAAAAPTTSSNPENWSSPAL